MGGGRREEGTIRGRGTETDNSRSQAQTLHRPCFSLQWLDMKKGKGYMCELVLHPQSGSDIIVLGLPVAGYD